MKLIKVIDINANQTFITFITFIYLMIFCGGLNG